jgi:hypothetical protein
LLESLPEPFANFENLLPSGGPFTVNSPTFSGPAGAPRIGTAFAYTAAAGIAAGKTVDIP